MCWIWRRSLLIVMLYTAMPIEGEVLDSGSGSGFTNDTNNCDDCNSPYVGPPPFLFLCQSGPCYHEGILWRIVPIPFLSHFPCFLTNTLTSLKECDMLIFFGSNKAKFDINFDATLPLVYDLCFVYTNLPKNTNFTESVVQFIREDNNIYNGRLNGIVGPNSADVATSFSKITGKYFKRISMSYSITDTKFEDEDNYPRFYATIPTDELTNRARLKLLYDFGWRRVAIVVSDVNDIAAKNFLDMTRQNDTMSVDFSGTYHDDPSTILEQYKNDDYRIFVAFINSNHARRLMCEAYQLDLTGENYVWILPGIYNQEWWSNSSYDSDDYVGNNCSDDDILTAIQSALFVDLPPIHFFDESKTKEAVDVIYEVYEALQFQFYRLHNRMLEDEIKFALHSRLAHSYDATRLMGTVWYHAYERLTNESLYQNEPLELCSYLNEPLRLFPDNDRLTYHMEQILHESAYCGLTGYHTFAKKTNRRMYGQVMITQFQESDECLVGLYQNIHIHDDACSNGHSTLSMYDIKNHQQSPDNFTFRNITSEYSDDFTFFVDICQYQWKGSDPFNAPTDGACHDESCECYDKLSFVEIIVSGVVLVVGVVGIISTVIFNFCYRANRHVKASSPRFNVLIILGCLFMYPVPLLSSISLSGDLMPVVTRAKAIPLVCELQKWLFYCGATVILATMLAINWRIYRIFYNKFIREKRSCLSDPALLAIIISLVVPVVICLMIWTLLDTYRYQPLKEPHSCPNVDVDDSINTYLITVDCTCTFESIWISVLLGYDSILCLALVWFSYQNAKISSHFAQVGEFAARVTFVVFLFFLPFFTLKLLLSLAVELILVKFWITFGLGVLFPSIIIGGLFVPKGIQMYKDSADLRRKKAAERKQRALSQVMDKKLKEIEMLESTLREHTNSIHQIRSRTDSGYSYGLHRPRPSERSESYRLGSPISFSVPDEFKNDVFK